MQGTFVSGCGERWKVVEMASGTAVSAEPLINLYALDLAPRLSKIWHAIRVLDSAFICRRAIEVGDGERAAEAGITLGESRKALGIKLKKAADGAKGATGRPDAGKTEERNFKILQCALEIRERNPHRKMSTSNLARLVINDMKLKIGARQVREIIKVGNLGS